MRDAKDGDRKAELEENRLSNNPAIVTLGVHVLRLIWPTEE